MTSAEPARPVWLVRDAPDDRKARGAFYTPVPIANFLAGWAVAGEPTAKVLDPTCGDGVFLMAAGLELKRLGGEVGVEPQLFGVDIHQPSLERSYTRLQNEGLDADLRAQDFFDIQAKGGFDQFNAVIGNPPYVRYQEHRGEARRRSLEGALRQGVRLSGLASSWAALLVHAASFLHPSGRLAMVLPAELLTVGYAEPVRQWLRQRFAAVKLVIFENLQFEDALENVVLLLAQGTGGCDAFSLYFVENGEDLQTIQPFNEFAVTPSSVGKWTDLLLNISQRQTYRAVVEANYKPLGEYGAPELGTVTGANDYFTMSESTRLRFSLAERDLLKISPPGTKHLKGLSFTAKDWDSLRQADERVWMLYPRDEARQSVGLRSYVAHGKELGVPRAYKCQIRSPWWKPPAVTPPDLFFTYMSHRFPRLITNHANATFVNSMHGVRLRKDAPRLARYALPLLALNSVTMLGAEIHGRSYGGGILKMEPSEVASLPVPSPELLAKAWTILRLERDVLNRQLRNGLWTNVVARIDQVLLRDTLGLSDDAASTLHQAARILRARRLSRGSSSNGDS